MHLKTNTGGLQRFVLSPENFEPHVIGMIPPMERAAVRGYRLALSRTAAGVEFWIIRDRDQTSLTHNDVYLGDWPPFLQLETTILAPMSPAEAAMLADLEVGAAIALAGIEMAPR